MGRVGKYENYAHHAAQKGRETLHGTARERRGQEEEEVWVLTGLEGAAELAGGGWPVGREGSSERGAPRERSPQSRARHRARW